MFIAEILVELKCGILPEANTASGRAIPCAASTESLGLSVFCSQLLPVALLTVSPSQPVITTLACALLIRLDLKS